jgi:hypothetical protein
MSMQSTGQGGTQSLHPMHQSAITTAIETIRAADRVDWTRVYAARAADAARSSIGRRLRASRRDLLRRRQLRTHSQTSSGPR